MEVIVRLQENSKMWRSDSVQSMTKCATLRPRKNRTKIFCKLEAAILIRFNTLAESGDTARGTTRYAPT